MVQEIINYLQVQTQVEKMLDNSHYKKRSIIEMCGFAVPTFYRKLKEKSFTAEELLKLSKILVPEEYYRYELEMELLKAEEDIKNNDTILKEDFIQDLRNKLV